MTGNSEIALDTSAAVKILNDAAVAAQVAARFSTVFISAVAAGELLYGAHNSARHTVNVPRFQAFIDDCQFIPVTREVTEIYARIRLQLKAKGKPIPDSDIWIAAASVHLSIPLATSDHHFSFIDNLQSVELTP